MRLVLLPLGRQPPDRRQLFSLEMDLSIHWHQSERPLALVIDHQGIIGGLKVVDSVEFDSLLGGLALSTVRRAVNPMVRRGLSAAGTFLVNEPGLRLTDRLVIDRRSSHRQLGLPLVLDQVMDISYLRCVYRLDLELLFSNVLR